MQKLGLATARTLETFPISDVQTKENGYATEEDGLDLAAESELAIVEVSSSGSTQFGQRECHLCLRQ